MQNLIMAWLYPGAPACSAATEYADGRHIDILKPQYFTVNANGILVKNTENVSGCNGYSDANIASVKRYSTQQFVTVSADADAMAALVSDRAKMTQFISTMNTFLVSTGFTGVELDFEGFAQWTANQYHAYLSFVSALGSSLHASGHFLMLDGPAIWDASSQGYYQWHWEDFDSGSVDALCVMAYDRQYDQGAGTPVTPLDWLKAVCLWMKARTSNDGKIVIGLPSYGYHGPTGGYAILIDTYEQSTHCPGFGAAQRDSPSGEMMWQQAGVSYNYSDVTTLNAKVQTVLDAGLSNVSIWHLGGANPWPTLRPGAVQKPVLQPQTSTPDPLFTAFNTKYPGFQKWYAQHFDANGNYIP